MKKKLQGLVFVFVKEEVVLCRIIGPDVLDCFVDVSFVFNLGKVFQNLGGSPASYGVVHQFFFGGWPWCIVQFLCQFQSPIHCFIVLWLLFCFVLLC